MTRSVSLLALIALALAACGASSAASSSSGTHATALTMQQVEAQTHGHPTVLLFTAQGCASCVGEAKALQDAAGGRTDLRLVGVDMDPGDTTQALAAYVQAIGLQSSGFIWMVDAEGSLVRRYDITSLSSAVFLDSSGQARFVNQGPQDAGTYSEQLSKLH
ncbi:MAG TPA: hypothetical protein VKI99_18925 [Candidatus Dormibacteraeota bacterium]|nr:hypothetical protein [Candidatus Dormibacteraeota bacterium]